MTEAQLALGMAVLAVLVAFSALGEVRSRRGHAAPPDNEPPTNPYKEDTSNDQAETE